MTSHSYYIGELFVLDHKTYRVDSISNNTVEASYASDSKPSINKYQFQIKTLNRKARFI